MTHTDHAIKQCAIVFRKTWLEQRSYLSLQPVLYRRDGGTEGRHKIDIKTCLLLCTRISGGIGNNPDLESDAYYIIYLP